MLTGLHNLTLNGTRESNKKRFSQNVRPYQFIVNILLQIERNTIFLKTLQKSDSYRSIPFKVLFTSRISKQRNTNRQADVETHCAALVLHQSQASRLQFKNMERQSKM